MQPHEIDALVHEARTVPTTATARWRATVARVLGRTPADGAGSPGPDGRRQFLKLGGTAVLGAAVLAACGEDETSPPSETGTTLPPTDTTLAPPQDTTPEDGATNDAAVTRTARSLELALVEVYEVFLAGAGESTAPDALQLPTEITFDPEVVAAFELLRDRHQGHAEAHASLVSAAGGQPVTSANAGVLAGLLRPELADLTSQEAVLRFARTMEDLSASTHAWGAGTLSTTELRQGLMAVGGVAARQAAVVALLIDPSGADAVTQPVLDASGPARLPAYMLLEEGMDGDDVPSEAPDPSAGADDEEDEEG